MATSRTPRPSRFASLAAALFCAAILAWGGTGWAQRDEGNSGSGSGSSSGSGSLGNTPIRELDEPRGIDRQPRGGREDSNSRRNNNENSGAKRGGLAERTRKAAAAAEVSAGVAQQGAPAGAAGRGIEGRARARVITGGAAESIASRAPSTSVVFNYKVQQGLTVLHFEPSDVILVEGETARVALRCHNPNIQSATRLHVGLRYNPAAVALIGVDPRPLVPFIRKPPKIRLSPEQGLLLIEVEFSQPVVFGSNPLVWLEWKALAPAPFEQVEVVDFVPYNGVEGERPLPSSLYDGRRSILGAKRIKNDGWVPLGFEILHDAEAVAASRTDSFDEEARRMSDPIVFGRGGRGGVEIELEPEREQLKPGEEMDVRVMFYNPRRSDLDSIRLLIDFDSKVLEVLDTDEGNAIASGVNIREGNRRAFPFDYFVENRVDNQRGSIEYRMGMAGEGTFPEEGVLATIRVRAKNLTGATRMEFRPQGTASGRRGSVASFIGKDVLGSEESLEDGLTGVRMTIR